MKFCCCVRVLCAADVDLAAAWIEPAMAAPADCGSDAVDRRAGGTISGNKAAWNTFVWFATQGSCGRPLLYRHITAGWVKKAIC